MTKVSKKVKTRNQYNQVGHHMGKWQKHKKHHTQESQDVSPFQQMTSRLQWTDKKAWQTRNINYKKDPQKKHRLGTVSKKITGGLKLVLWYQPHPYFRCGPRQIDIWFTWKIPNNLFCCSFYNEIFLIRLKMISFLLYLYILVALWVAVGEVQRSTSIF